MEFEQFKKNKILWQSNLPFPKILHLKKQPLDYHLFRNCFGSSSTLHICIPDSIDLGKIHHFAGIGMYSHRSGKCGWGSVFTSAGNMGAFSRIVFFFY